MRVSNGYGKNYSIKFYDIQALCLIIIKVAIELSMCNEFVINNRTAPVHRKKHIVLAQSALKTSHEQCCFTSWVFLLVSTVFLNLLHYILPAHHSYFKSLPYTQTGEGWIIINKTILILM